MLGWTAVLASALRAVLLPSTNGRTNWQERLTTVYDHSSMFVKPFQVLALLETMHAVLGLVRSPVLPGVYAMDGKDARFDVRHGSCYALAKNNRCGSVDFMLGYD